MRTIQPEPFNVYTIEELTDKKAKEKAIEFCREDATNDELLHEFTVEETKERLVNMGFSDPKVYYSCSYSQGDGACFVANNMVHFDKFLPAIKKLFNKTQWKVLQKIYRSGMELELSLTHRGHYYPENSVSVSLGIHDHGIEKFIGDVHVTKYLIEIESVIESWYVDFCKGLHKQLCDSIEYYWKDENCIQYAKDREFEFTKYGKLYRD